MKLVHYTSAPQALLAMREGLVPSDHQGFDRPQTSFVPAEAEPPVMYWDVWYGASWLLKGRARLTVEVPDRFVVNWAKACRNRVLVAETKERSPGYQQWLVVEGPIPAEFIVKCELFYGPDAFDEEHRSPGKYLWDYSSGEWLEVWDATLSNMLRGLTLVIRSPGSDRVIQF